MRKFGIAVVALILGLVVFSFTPPADRYFQIAKNLDIFASVFKEVNSLYVDETNPNILIKTGIDAMLQSLDPYTNYVPEDEVEDFLTTITSQYGGIGALTTVFENRTVISMVYEGFPAYKNGLKIGDEVIAVDGIEIEPLSTDEVNQLTRGQVGTTITLTVKRFGVNNPLNLQFKREKIKINNVPYSGMLNTDVGYIELTIFNPDAGREVKNALVKLKEQGAKNIILDLRGNPGGLLIESVNICNLFIPKGKKVVTTKGKTTDSNVIYETLNEPIDLDIPVIVLIDRESASASEIVAGTLQDYDRGVILGEKSFGKGLVQVNRQLPYNSQVKITTAKYYTPTGRCIQVLDYSHRKEDGSVDAIADSVKRVFKTSNGRDVFDGGGVDPDVKVGGNDISSFTEHLVSKGFIFDYATEYAYTRPTIPAGKTFSLSDKEYLEFAEWMKQKDIGYISPLELQVNKLTVQAHREKYYEVVGTQLQQVKSKIQESHKNDLFFFKPEIKKQLEENIASRFYLGSGKSEVGLSKDPDVQRSIELFNQPDEYIKILGSTNSKK
ncbi:MAG: S41 family peptidase [Flammeovirgaceae bacterium]|nr:S41 family peptidase [Flammeovirgaceae bacterium]